MLTSLQVDAWRPWLVAVSAVVLFGCASTQIVTMPIPVDLTAVERPELVALDEKLRAEQAGFEASSAPAVELADKVRLVTAEIGRRDADAARERLAGLDRDEDGLVPVGSVREQMQLAEDISRWDEGAFEAVRVELQTELDATQASIDAKVVELDRSSDEVSEQRLEQIAEIAALYGTETTEGRDLLKQRQDMLTVLSQRAEAAIENQDFERAQELLGIVEVAKPDDEEARLTKCEVDGRVFLKRFSAVLETGRVGGTRKMLTDLAEKDCFNEIKSWLGASAQPMTEAFALLGQEAAAQGNLSLAYERYRDTRELQELLLDRQSMPGVEEFLAKVDREYAAATKSGEHGLAWGHLQVMLEFSQMTPQMRRRVRSTKSLVEQKAMIGLTAFPFSDSTTSAAKVGDAVSSKVIQHIFKAIPTEVRIVEREQLTRILDECQRVGNCDALATADYIIQGSILDAKVETSQESGTERRRVLTGTRTVPNPTYEQWLSLSDRERRRTTKPVTSLTQEVMEDIALEVNTVRKVGVISVSFRVVQANTGRVLFTDSMQAKQSHRDQGVQGVELGEYKLATRFVELPQDIEILSGNDGLADQVSTDIGERLVEFMRNPEDSYERDAKQFEDEGDFPAAARQAAYAHVIRVNKDRDQREIMAVLKRYSMRATL